MSVVTMSYCRVECWQLAAAAVAPLAAPPVVTGASARHVTPFTRTLFILGVASYTMWDSLPLDLLFNLFRGIRSGDCC